MGNMGELSMAKRIFLLIALLIVCALPGCGLKKAIQENRTSVNSNAEENEQDMELSDIVPEEKIIELEDGFSAVRYEGDYGFDEFLSRGGASTDGEVIQYLAGNLLGNLDLGFAGDIFGCSTITAQSSDGEFLFGRNFDWNTCDAMVVLSYPENSYASISTVNMDFIRQGAGGIAGLVLKAEDVRTVAALYPVLSGRRGFSRIYSCEIF